MVENKIRNYSVSQSCKISNQSYFSGNECIYRKELLHRHHYIGLTTLGHKLVTLLIANRQYIQFKLSWRKLILFNFNGQMLDRLLLQIRPVTVLKIDILQAQVLPGCRHAKKQCSKLL